MPTRATVQIRTLAPSAETVIYGVAFVLRLPTGVTVPADPDSGAVLPEALHVAHGGALAGARYAPATAGARGSVTVLIADQGGFTAGELITLTCSLAPGSAVTPADFSLDDFSARNANGAALPGITPHLTLQTE